MQPNYKPYDERIPDPQYTDLLRTILDQGRPMQTGFHQGIGAYQYLGARLEFDLSNGFPLMPHRNVKGAFKGALAEIIAFINGVRDQKGLVEMGCPWWADWVTDKKCADFGLPPGDLGDGSYGVALHDYPSPDGPFNQVQALVEQMRDFPASRTHVLTTWVPRYDLQSKTRQRKVVVAPCHGTVVHFQLDPATKDLELVQFQRSGDVPVGVIFNFVHYAALGMMFAQVLGYRMKRMVYIVSDAHIYQNQIEGPDKDGNTVRFVDEVLSRELKRFPTVTIDESVKDIFAFRPEHFVLTDYDPHPALRIPTPI